MIPYQSKFKKWKRYMSFSLSLILALMLVFPYLPQIKVKAGGKIGETVTITNIYGGNTGFSHNLYCVDGTGYHQWAVLGDGDEYTNRTLDTTDFDKTQQTR